MTNTQNHLRADYFSDRYEDVALCGVIGVGDYSHPEDVTCPRCLAAPIPMTLRDWLTSIQP